MPNNVFRGPVTIHLPAQEALNKTRRAMLKVAFNNGKDLPRQVRYGCAIALAVNDSFKDGVIVDGEVVAQPHPLSKAQFGKYNGHDYPYLTVGMIDVATGMPYAVTWEGGTDVFPLLMLEIAPKYDLGEKASATEVCLWLEDATVRPIVTTPKAKTKAKGGRSKPNVVRRKPAVAQTYDRICSDDIVRISAEAEAKA